MIKISLGVDVETAAKNLRVVTGRVPFIPPDTRTARFRYVGCGDLCCTLKRIIFIIHGPWGVARVEVAWHVVYTVAVCWRNMPRQNSLKYAGYDNVFFGTTPDSQLG